MDSDAEVIILKEVTIRKGAIPPQAILPDVFPLNMPQRVILFPPIPSTDLSRVACGRVYAWLNDDFWLFTADRANG